MRNSFSKSFMAAFLFAAIFVSGCSRAVVEGQCDSSYAGKMLEVTMFDLSSYSDKTVDSVKISPDGKWKVSLKIDRESPEFVYVFVDSTKMASLVVKSGDRISLSYNSDSKFPVVEGSEESSLYTEVEKDYAKALSKLSMLASRLANSGNPTTTSQVRKEISSAYLQYYRSSVKFLVTHPHSFVCIPVLYQNLGVTPVFATVADGVHFLRIADSLAVDYPDSRYINQLRAEGKKRMESMKIQSQISNAEQVICPDINLNDIEGVPQTLYNSFSKVTLLYFWTASDAMTNRYNVDVLVPFYQKMHDKGVNIYAVSLDTDKVLWASCVKGQNLPWVNVNDILGADSQTVTLFNVTKIPCIYLITENDIKRSDAIDGASLERIVLEMLENEASQPSRSE